MRTTVHDGDTQAIKSIMNLEPMPMVAPIFVEDGQTSSSIVIVNNSAIDGGATITIHAHADEGVKAFELVNDGLPGTIAAFGLAPHKHKDDIALSAIPLRTGQ